MSGASAIGAAGAYGGAGNIARGGVDQGMALRQEVLARSEALQDVQNARANGAAGNVSAPASAAGLAGPATNTGPQQVGGFADVLTKVSPVLKRLQQVSQVQARSSDMQAAYERGEVTDIAKVMLARQEAGVAFEATLQVRNKLLSAYQDIMRMGS